MNLFTHHESACSAIVDRMPAPVAAVFAPDLPVSRGIDRAKLIHEITAQDIRDSKRKGYNRYALAHMYRAADECLEAIEAGYTPAMAFSKHFTPARQNHSIARKLGIPLDVQRGQWVFTAPIISQHPCKFGRDRQH